MRALLWLDALIYILGGIMDLSLLHHILSFMQYSMQHSMQPQILARKKTSLNTAF